MWRWSNFLLQRRPMSNYLNLFVCPLCGFEHYFDIDNGPGGDEHCEYCEICGEKLTNDKLSEIAAGGGGM